MERCRHLPNRQELSQGRMIEKYYASHTNFRSTPLQSTLDCDEEEKISKEVSLTDVALKTPVLAEPADQETDV